ncbi:Ohr subfamily peroxiredoxin [Curtobacterium luteum]|uniref:Ohr subfamily peroxiredoxin n=1 Tax=Curtobacterium luteum TaxID=33881 RepID=A0A7Y6EKN4_9MICO|nr:MULTISPECIES: organic hydroperoxide resistance protein [Curtobacterium]MBM7802601.1 Ohr subfamily peroxiredoxin [Curtobacterium luteum]NUU50276.1 organic hydroperoxide resistance protein [Curtobacterium luteum]NUU50407.1 organic hydroperoxide resistance protein [Curtobacterium luteum]GGL06612.1 putative organic hydroperoxide resistance protein/OsmC-like protein [Curtobacterium luteum]
MEALYTAEALSTGAGRDGRVATSDGSFALDLAIPKEMGGSGAGTNPEQLFAAGYAACFHSALQGVARAQKVKIADSSVGGRVQIGPNGNGGYQLAVLLEVVLPGLEHDQAQALADAAHQVCPYSNATRGNIDVTITVSED